MGNKNRIGFFIYSLCFGGAERVLVEIVKHLSRTHFDIFIVARKLNGEYLLEIPSDVVLSEFPSGMKLFRPLHFKKAIRNTLQRLRLDIVCCFGPEISIMMAFSGPHDSVKWCITEHTIPSKCFGKSLSGIIRRFLIKLCYKKADRVIGVSQAVINDLHTNFKVPSNILNVINNPISEPGVSVVSSKYLPSTRNKIIVTCGRLVKLKNFDRLISAFAVASSHVSSHLIIIGDGPERKDLEKLSRKLHVSNKITLTGYTNNPHYYFKKASFFVLNSSYEGFGNVLVEAMAYGLPVISSKNGGAEDIVINDYNGILVPVHDDKALTAAIRHLLENEEDRNKMSCNAMEHSKKFSIENIIKQYSQLFLGLSNK